jgi:hypothetical protein
LNACDNHFITSAITTIITNPLKIKKMKTEMKIRKTMVGMILFTLSLMPKTVIKRVIAALNTSKLSKIGTFIGKAKFITKSMAAAGWFPSPPIPLATVNTDITNLDAAQTTALSRAKGASQARDDKKVIVLGDLHQLMAYVQTIADANPRNAETIITSSGFDVKHGSPRNKDAITVRPKKGESGTMIAIVKKVAGSIANQWQSSLDGGKTWIDLPTTSKIKTEITGLTPGSSLMVRHCPVLRKGKGTWLTSAMVIVV